MSVSEMAQVLAGFGSTNPVSVLESGRNPVMRGLEKDGCECRYLGVHAYTIKSS